MFASRADRKFKPVRSEARKVAIVSPDEHFRARQYASLANHADYAVSKSAPGYEALYQEKPTPDIMLVDFDTDADELRIVGPQRDLPHLADGDAGELHLCALVQSVDRLFEKYIIFLTLAAAVVRQPDHEQRERNGEQQDEGPDQNIVRPRFHQLFLSARVSASLLPEAARPRGPLKYSCIQGCSVARSSGIVPTAITFFSASTATRSQVA